MKIEQGEQELKNLKVEETLKEANIKLTEEQTRELYHRIIQGYISGGIKGAETIIGGFLSKMVKY